MYLCGTRFAIISDHKPLQHIFSETSAIPSMASARIQCWALLLSGYDYTISYKPGPDNANSDMLSRLPSSPPLSNIPTPTETVLLLEALDSSPIISSHIRQWTAKEPTLTKVQDCLITGEHPDEDVADYAGPFLGHMFLIIVDAFSKWLEVVKVPSATSGITTEKLHSIFCNSRHSLNIGYRQWTSIC